MFADLSFTITEWNHEERKRINTVHYASALRLASNNDHNIPDGFTLRSWCNKEQFESWLDLEPSHVRYPDIFQDETQTLVVCETCAAAREKRK